jgi:alpha-L-rhamnosidase
MNTKFSFILMLSLGLLAACKQQASSTVGVRADALDPAAWETSIWISAADAPVVSGRNVQRAADGASWFVSTVENTQAVASAKWMTTGLGVYELYVNGQPVGQEVLKPGFTHPYKTRTSFTYDITDAFNKRAGAANQLAAQVTPGWWADKIVTPGGYNGMLGRKCAFRAVLELTYADGTKALFGTDTDNWRAGIAGPVKHAAIFDGEFYDARELPGFAVADRLGKPEVNTEFTGEIVPSVGAEIYLREDLALAPVEAYTWQEIEGADEQAYGKVVVARAFAPGEELVVRPGETLVVDFGQNAAAVPAFVFKAAEGTVLTCLPGELLNDGNGAKSRGMDGPEGSVHRTNLRIPDDGMQLEYTFGPAKGYVSYHPHCTFFGYRFASITATDEVRIRSLVSLPVTSIAQDLETGTITTGDESVNKLISNTLWGQRSNYLSVPTDCPQRNERLGWTADTQVFSETGTFFANTDAFFHKWMRDMRDSQSETGGFPGVAPLAQYGGDMMRLGWADAGIIVPWTVWKQFGDPAIIEENWAAMEHFMQHVNDTKYDHRALVSENGNYQWADWLSYEPMESHGGSAFTTDRNGRRAPLPESVIYWNYLSACYWAQDAEMMRDMAAATGRDAAKYQTMVDEARAFLKKTFLDGKGGFKTVIFNTMQTPALFALKNGLVEGPAKEAMKARLRANFAAHGGCLQTGFLGTSILMQTLTENGMADIAWDLIFQRKNPSWLYSVDNGATTIWERWNSYTLESGMGPKGMNSFNHYAYGCVCQWLWETAAGIATDLAAPGFKHIRLAPVPDKRLGHLEAEYNSAAGLVKSAWRYDGDKWTWDFTIPEGTSATVILPDGSAPKEYTPGTYHIEI